MVAVQALRGATTVDHTEIAVLHVALVVARTLEAVRMVHVPLEVARTLVALTAAWALTLAVPTALEALTLVEVTSEDVDN